MIEVLFWISLGLIAYTYIGYPVLLLILNLVYRAPHMTGDMEPAVSITMAARNEASEIETKLESCLRLDYPKEKLEIIVGSDGSTDETVKIASRFKEQGVRVFDLPRMGKALVNNRMVGEASGELIVDTSASGHVEPAFLRNLVRHFADEKCGCVTGESYFGNMKGFTSSLEDTYFRYEWELRALESRLGVLCVSNGGVLAFRKSLYDPIDPSSDVDNMVPLQIVEKRYRVIHDPMARTLGEAAYESPDEQLRCRIRQVTRSQQDIFRAKALLNPFKHPKFTFVLCSRRLLRWWVPFLMISSFVTNLFLLSSPVYQIALAAQLSMYAVGFIGIVRPSFLMSSRFLGLPASLINVNMAFLVGTIRAFRGEKIVTW